MGLWATWSTRGVGIRWSLRPLPTQIILRFYGIVVYLQRENFDNSFRQHSWLQQPAHVEEILDCLSNCYRDPCLCGVEPRPRNLNSVLYFARKLLCKFPNGFQQPGTVPGIIMVVTLFSLQLVRSFRIFINMAPQEYRQQNVSVMLLIGLLRSPYRYICRSVWI